MSWKLSSCRTDCDGQKVYIIDSTLDLDPLIGKVINGINITGKVINPDYCWKVSGSILTPVDILISYNTFYSNCDYCVCGCCTEGIPVASVCATLDMTQVDLSLLGVNDSITVTFIGSPSNLVLATITGDFSGYTLQQLIQAVVTGILTGGSGFPTHQSGTDIIICTPADLGSDPIGSSVNITFTPIYYLKNEAQNNGNYILGYGSDSGEVKTGRPAFVPASESGYTNDLLYVPNGDVPTGTKVPYDPTTPFTQWPLGSTFTIDLSAGVGGNPYTIGIPASMSTFIYSGGPPATRFVVTDAGSGANITADIIAYNQGTGQLDFNIITVTSPAPPGAIPWVFTIRGLTPYLQAFGTINVYDVDSVTGALTINPASPIEISAGNPQDSYYDSITKSVFFACFGSSGSQAAITKIGVDVTGGDNPFAVEAYLKNTGGFTQGNKFNLNPISNNFYWNCTSPQALLKFGKGDDGAGNMNQYLCSSVFPCGTAPCTAITAFCAADVPYNAASSITFNDDIAGMPHRGEVYYAPNTKFVYKLETNLSPVIKDTVGLATTPANPLIDLLDFNQPATSIFPIDPTILTLSVNDEGLFYYAPLKRMYVMRNLSVANTFEFQSYQIHDLVTGAQLTNVQINASKIVYPFPAFAAPVGSTCGGLPGGPTCGGKFTFQPGVNQIFITAATNFVIIFDPAKGLTPATAFSNQVVAQCNGVSQFAYRDDDITPNFFGSINHGNTSPAIPDYLSVVSIRTPADLLSATFEGELNCSPCLPEEIVIFQRTIPDPVKIFYQIKESACDINVIQRFSGGFWSKMKELRYGITDCCKNINLDALWVSKQISDLDSLLIPDITCRAVPTPGCCPWLPTQACQLIPDPSGGTSIVGVAGEAIFFGKLVMLGINGKFYLNQSMDVSTYQRAVGFATLDAVINQQVRVLISGQLVNTGWSLIPGAIYYATSNGNITSTIPITGISQVVGIALSFNTLMVEIRQPIIL